jgi:LPS-assembly protein
MNSRFIGWRRRVLITLAALGAFSFGPPAGRAVSTGPQEAGGTPEVEIVARNKEMTKDRVYASGDVEIHYRNIRLFADSVEYNPGTKDVLAQGNVVIQLADEVIRAEQAVFNLDTGMGKIEKASGMIQPSLFYSAASIERVSQDVYDLSRARVTTCSQPVPRWDFSFSRAVLRKDTSIRMWNAVFTLKNIPVFYLPYLSYPLEDRATGFLLPNIGFSGPKGFLVSESFYWAMARNMDATVGLDYYPTQGLGLGLQYRYLLSKGTGGQLDLYYFLFNRNALNAGLGPSTVIRMKHNQELPGGFTLAASVDYESSFNFLQNFDTDFSQASVSNQSSQVFLSRSWSRFNVSVRASRVTTYFFDVNDSIASTSLPQINFNVFKVKLFSPVYFSMTGMFNSWQYGWNSEYQAGTERHSTDLAVSPTLSLPFSSIPWLTANTSVGLNLAYYGESLVPGTTQIVHSPLITKNVAFSLDLTGPVLYKIFYDADGEPRLKNIIEPSFNYTYDSPISQADRIVTPYGFYLYNQMSYGVTSRFLLKKADRPVEVLSFGLSQTYYFSPQNGPLSQYLIDGKPPRFSEITGFVRYYPNENYSIDAALGFNPYYHDFSTLRLTATAGSKADGRFVSLNWYRSLNAWLTGVDPELQALYNRHQIGVSFGWRFPTLKFQGEVDYNIQTKQLLYTAGQIIYHYQCLDFLVEVGSFFYRPQPETEFKFSIGFGNIGRAPDLLGGFGF